MKLTSNLVDKLRDKFTFEDNDDFFIEFSINIVEESDGTFTAYIGTYPEVNSYDKKRKVTSTEDVVDFFADYINDLQRI